jgi:LysM repeat protein
VLGALDRGQLAQALLLLSDWYGDPSLTPAESQEVETLLSQLAGSVIYEGPPAHRLEKPYIVASGDTIDSIASKYSVPAALLAKINGVAQGAPLEPGKELKVVRGPFSAVVELGKRKMTLMLDRRYAGQFAIEIDPTTTIEEGQWKVDQKLLTPASPGLYSQTPAGEDRSLLLANPASASGQAAILRGPGGGDALSAEPRGRVIRLKSGDVNDVYDILSEGSRVTIRR